MFSYQDGKHWDFSHRIALKDCSLFIAKGGGGVGDFLKNKGK